MMSTGSGPVERTTVLDRGYEEVESASLTTLREYLSSDGADPNALSKAKIAAAALGSVQSHKRTSLGRRVLDFEMARSLTTDPDKLADYIRLTQPASGILRALPDKAG